MLQRRAMHTWDYVAIGTYFAAVVAIGLWVSLRTKSDEDLFLAGRDLGAAAVGLSLFASNISSTTLVGLMGEAYRTGIAVANYEWMAGLLFILIAAVVAPVYLRNQVSTVPDFLRMRYGVKAQRYLSGLTVLVTLVVDTAGGLYAGTLILQALFPGLPFLWTALGLAAFVGVYTAFGGLKAVVYTDTIQAVILLAGSGLMLLFAHLSADGGLLAVLERTPRHHLDLLPPLGHEGLPWLGTLLGVPIIGFYFWATNQYITQRILAARGIHAARRGCSLAAYLKLLPLFVMVLPGVVAIELFPGVDQPDQVFTLMTTELLPRGIRGLVLAGLVAAIMSSLDSTLNAVAALVSHDFVYPLKPDMSKRARAWLGRSLTLGFATLAGLWAPVIAQFGGLFNYLQQVMAYLCPPVVVIFLWGFLSRRGTERAALITLAVGHVCGVAAFVANQAGLLPLHFTLHVPVLVVIALGAFALSAQRRTENDVVTWTPEHAGNDDAWYADYRVHGAVVAALIAVTLVVFR